MNKYFLSLLVMTSFLTGTAIADQPMKQPVRYPIAIPLSEEINPVRGCFTDKAKKDLTIANDQTQYTLKAPVVELVYQRDLAEKKSKMIGSYCAVDFVQQLTDAIDVSCQAYALTTQKSAGATDAFGDDGIAKEKFEVTTHSVTCQKIQTCWVSADTYKAYLKSHELPDVCADL